MAIRFDRAYNAEIRKVVKNFNQKRNRAIKRGFKNLPDPLTVSELKSRYTTRKELNRDLNRYRRFIQQKDDALKTVETSGGAKAIKWEYDFLKRNLKAAKAFYDREIRNARNLDTPLLYAQSEYINNLKAKRSQLDLELSELTQPQFRAFRATINEYLANNYNNTQNYRGWMNEVENIMRYLGYDNKSINRFFEGFDQLSPQEFLTMYRQSNLISRIYELYIPSRSGDFRLSTTEEDAKELIDSFMERKKEMIKKAKLETRMQDNSRLEEFHKSIRKTQAEKTTRDERFKRSNLSAEDIRNIEALGWGDIIEDD